MIHYSTVGKLAIGCMGSSWFVLPAKAAGGINPNATPTPASPKCHKAAFGGGAFEGDEGPSPKSDSSASDLPSRVLREGTSR